MKKASFPISLLALALCFLASPSQAQDQFESTTLAMAPTSGATPISAQRTQRSRTQSSRPTARPSSRPSSRPAARPAQRSSSRPAARPTQRPSSRPAARPAQRPTSRPAARPAQRPTSRPTARPAQRPTSRPAARPAQRPSSQPAARPAQQPRSQPSARPASQPNRSTRPTSTGRTAPTRTTAPRSSSGSTGSLFNPTYTPKPTRTVVPRVSNSTALQRARERARKTARPTSTTTKNRQPTTAQRIQQDRLRRARSATNGGQKSQAQRKVSGSQSKVRNSGSVDKARASAGASRIQAARDRIRRANEAGSQQKGRTAGGLKVRPNGIKPNGAKAKTGQKDRSGSQAGKGISGRKGSQGTGQPGLKARDAKRTKTARKDYIDSQSGGSIPGGVLKASGGRPGLDHASSRGRGGITPGANDGRGGGAITPGSGHGRNLWRHNNGGYRHDPYSHYYWNWNMWGSGYGWFWCPTQWATACWWDSYWYNGGYWNYGYRPSFYYSGPFTPPSYTVIVQVNEAPIEIVEEVLVDPSPPVQVGEAVAPAPAVVPAINRAAEYYLTLGDRAFRAGRYSDAVHHYGKAVEYSPGEGILYLILSDALFATGDYHYGAFTLRKAFDLDPGLVDLTVDKRSFYDRPVDLDAQMTRARTFNLQNPGDNDARLMLIANEVFVGNPAGALNLLGQPEAAATAQSTAGILLGERARADLEVAQEATTTDAVFEVVPLDQE